jgi:ABC-2 type transport system permease protein|tara:strand:+ start:1677 stop:2591 length:915 start_codon:yes stop_codon:yes gene_type:complete
MIQVLKAMIVREIQEHKVAFVYAPFFVSIILCLVIASVYFGGTNIQTDQFNFSTEYYDEEIRQAMQSVSSVSRIDIVRTGLLVLGFPILLTVGFGLLAYSLSTFADERKDRSLIFWRSLPVSDLTTVLSKVFTVTLIVPLMVLPYIILLQLVSMTSASIFFATNDIVSFGWLWGSYIFTDWFRIIFSLWAQSLWSLPLFLWLMLAGTYAARPIAGAIVPPVILIVLEGIIFKTNLVLEFIENRIGFWSRADSFPKEYQELRVVDVSDILLLFSTQAFWIGILASVILVAGIVYVRSSNSDHAID